MTIPLTFVRASRARRVALLSGVATAGLGLVMAFTLPGAAIAAPAPVPATTPVSPTAPAAKPTIVLVHGAFADASGWSGEITRLTRLGYPVIAPPDPLRGPISDGDYIRSVLATIPGPVVLVGHSYGGEVITNAAVGAPNVKALVYISAFIPEKGDTVAHFTAQTPYPGSLISEQTLLIRPVANPSAPPAADGSVLNDADAYIAPASFRAVFAGDQSVAKAAVMAAEQRPLSYFADNQASGAPAWAHLPSWALVGLEDKAIPPAAELFMAKRASAHTVVIHSAHDSLVSHPAVVTDLILQAARSVG